MNRPPAGGISAILGVEAGVVDLFALFRRKGEARRRNSADARRTIAPPVTGPMFTNRTEPMNLRRAPKPPKVPKPSRPAPARPFPAPRDQGRQESKKPEPGRQEPPARPERPPSERPQSETPRPEPARAEPNRQEPRRDGNGAWHHTTHGYLAAHGVERSFVGRKVVKGVSLYVRRGEAVGLLGPNGAGKTTVFYMITGLITADRGRIELDGHDVTALPMYQRARLGIGYLPQEASIFRGLNVEENIRAVLEVVEPNRKRREHDLDSLLEEFNITRLRKTPSIALSGG